MDKSFLEALKKVKGKQLDEAMTVPGTKPNPDPKNYGFFSKNNQSPYGFARGGSDEDSAANFFASDKRMRDAQAAAQQTQQAAPVQRKARPTPPAPLPPRVPRSSQSSAGDGNVTGGRTAAPVAPASSGEAGVRKADQISNTDRAIESGMRDGSQTPANVIAGNRSQQGRPGGPEAGTGATSRTLGVVAGAGGGNAADERARAGMSDEKKKEIDDQAAARQSQMDSERAANLAAQQKKREELSSQPSQPSIADRVKNFFSSSSSSTPSASASETPSSDSTPQSRRRSAVQNIGNDESLESGPIKGKKKMSESMIDAFLKLQATGASNMFEAAKKAKKDYDKDGKIESDKDEVWGSRFAAAKKAGKMEEELKGDQDKIDANKNGKIDGQDFKLLRGKKKMEENAKPTVDTSPIKKSTTTDPDFAAPSANPDAPKSPITYTPKKTNEEVSFSEAELAHFEAVIARKDMKGKENALNPTVDSANLTDEYIDEMARGVKAGTKRGSYKKKATDLAGNKVKGADAATDDSDKGIPHVLDQIRSAKEDEKGHITLKDHDSDPASPKTASVHRKVARDFYTDYHNTEKPADKNAKLSDFKSKVFG